MKQSKNAPFYENAFHWDTLESSWKELSNELFITGRRGNFECGLVAERKKSYEGLRRRGCIRKVGCRDPSCECGLRMRSEMRGGGEVEDKAVLWYRIGCVMFWG